MKKLFFVLIAAVTIAVQYSYAQMSVNVIQANDSVAPQKPISIKFEGKVQECYEYKDAAGQHLFLATATGKGKNFFCTAYTMVNGAYVQDWQIKDYAEITVDMSDNCTKFVDIDKDGVYETIFVYSYWTEKPKEKFVGTTWKLMLHYKNKKYAIRAYEPDSDDDEPELMMDKSFDTLPKAVKAYVIQYWDSLAKANRFHMTFSGK
ncbi:MAG: hypothetical protein V4577_14640 [Bacteroidota bacterium]